MARERAYVERAYQVRAAIEAVTLAMNGENVGLELPTGTGKTLIACLAAVMWKYRHPDDRVLLIVPSRTLVVQHFDVAYWIASNLRTDRLTDKHYGDPAAIRSTLVRGDFVISTPGILAGALGRGLVDTDVVSSFGLIIVDEWDQFIVVDEEDRGSVARFAEHWQALVKQLPQRARYLVKSATLSSPRLKRASHSAGKIPVRDHFVERLLSPVKIEVPERDYASIVPCQEIIRVKVADSRVSSLLRGVSLSKGIAHRRLDELIGPVDYRDVERRAPILCEAPLGRLVKLRLARGGMRSFPMTHAIRQQLSGIVTLMMMPQHIDEDLTRNLDVRIGSCEIKTELNAQVFLKGVPMLVDRRPGEAKHFGFQRGGKTDASLRIVAERAAAGQRGVLFLRTVTLLEGMRPLLAAKGLPLFELTGEKSDEERRTAITGFRQSGNGVLLMTRTTGGRGLDLPFAHYAVFYSPKTNPVTMWQEMSRIRSTVSDLKDIYLMCYGDDEVATLDEVVSELQSQGRQVLLRKGLSA